MALDSLKWPLLLAAQQWSWLGAGLGILFARGRAQLAHRGNWEEEYRAGRWRWLQGGSEMFHHYLIGCCREQVSPNGAILDVGCGEGASQLALCRFGYDRYVGLDISETAIQAAARRNDERTRFIVADAETFKADEHFDVIILNETLYYSERPAVTLARYETFLTPDGVCIVSMGFHSFRDGLMVLRIWRDIRRDREVLESLTLFRPRGPLRTVKVLRPGPAVRIQGGVVSGLRNEPDSAVTRRKRLRDGEV